MIVLLKCSVLHQSVSDFFEKVKVKYNCQVIITDALNVCVVSKDADLVQELRSMDFVVDVSVVNTRYLLSHKLARLADSKVFVNGEDLFANKCVISGPCSVEGYDEFERIVVGLLNLGVKNIRGGIFKPRTSFNEFQGLGYEGIKIVKRLKEKYEFNFVCEVMEISQIESLLEVADILQVGARNMQNYDLLKALGELDTPIILKRASGGLVEEWLCAADYILAGGNSNVILCERGIRTFETSYRNTLDLNAVLFAKMHSHLPVIVDPSHGCGLDWMVPGLAKAAFSVGADGILVESHFDPSSAVSDAAQTISLDSLHKLLNEINP